jgi:hypothetical protein
MGGSAIPLSTRLPDDCGASCNPGSSNLSEGRLAGRCDPLLQLFNVQLVHFAVRTRHPTGSLYLSKLELKLIRRHETPPCTKGMVGSSRVLPPFSDTEVHSTSAQDCDLFALSGSRLVSAETPRPRPACRRADGSARASSDQSGSNPRFRRLLDGMVSEVWASCGAALIIFQRRQPVMPSRDNRRQRGAQSGGAGWRAQSEPGWVRVSVYLVRGGDRRPRPHP